MKPYAPGTLIADRYEVASHPMMGGMGIVYVCLDRQDDRPVALKTFKPEYLPDRAARDRFLREGTHWVDVGAHPHVVCCYHVLRIDPEVYLVLELVAKEQGRDDASLRAWLTPGQRLPVEQALLFALQIVRGMQHATERISGLVHRDLKPENVLVGADRLSQANLPGANPSQTGVNRLRVTDFGLAAVLESAGQRIDKSAMSGTGPAPRNTQLTHGIVGTPLYMAPEQWAGGGVGVWTDVYALGCILYEMLTGRCAVSGRSLDALQRAHCEGDLRPLPAGLPAPARALLTRCLVAEPEERYGGWEQVEEGIVAAYEEVTGHPAPEATTVTDLSREERVRVSWSYNAMGLSYLDIGKAEVAAGYFERARAGGAAEDELQLEAAGLNNLGITYARLGGARRAIGYYDQCLTIFREIGDRRGEGQTLINLGVAYLNLGDARRAISFFEKHLAIAREIGDPQQGSGQALGNLGLAYMNLGDAHRAIGFFEQHLAIARETANRREEGYALSNLGLAYMNLGDARRAIGFYEQSLELKREIGDRRGEGNTMSNLAGAYLQLGDARRGIAVYERSLGIMREIGDRRGEGAALGNLGFAYMNLGDARQAISLYEQRLPITREVGDRLGEGQTLGNLGAAYMNLGDTRRAIDFYEQHLAIAREIDDRRGEGMALGNLGSAHLQLGDVRQATVFHRQSLDIMREVGDRHGEGQVLGNLGVAYMMLGDTRRAIHFYEQDLAVTREIGNRQGEAFVCWNLGLLYEQQGDLARAAELMQVCVDFEREIGHPDAEEDAAYVARLRSG